MITRAAVARATNQYLKDHDYIALRCNSNSPERFEVSQLPWLRAWQGQRIATIHYHDTHATIEPPNHLGIYQRILLTGLLSGTTHYYADPDYPASILEALNALIISGHR